MTACFYRDTIETNDMPEGETRRSGEFNNVPLGHASVPKKIVPSTNMPLTTENAHSKVHKVNMELTVVLILLLTFRRPCSFVRHRASFLAGAMLFIKLQRKMHSWHAMHPSFPIIHAHPSLFAVEIRRFYVMRHQRVVTGDKYEDAHHIPLPPSGPTYW